MIAHARHPEAIRPARGAGWVPLKDAAALLGKSEGRLRHECARLEGQGMARKSVINGRLTWEIAQAYSPRLHREAVERTESGTSIVNDLLRSCTAEQRQKAELKFRVLRAFREAKARAGDGGFDFDRFRKRMRDEHGWCPGRARLYQMHADCPPSADAAACVAALVDLRGRPAGIIESCSDAAWAYFQTCYLDMRQWSVKKCDRAVRAKAEEEGWAWPSYSRVLQLKRERIDPSAECLAREGKMAWDRKFKAPMQQNPDAYRVGQCWESDHAKLDFEIRVVKGDGWVRTRPELTSWFDRRTRRIMGWAISEQGNQETIRAAMLHALRQADCSTPEEVVIDNGKDFMARSIAGMTKAARRNASRDEIEEAEATATGLLNMLGIEPRFAAPYNHNGKARIERWHGTIHADFDKEWKSYIGNRPGAIERLDLPKEMRDTLNLPTLAEVREGFAKWVEWYNHRTDHRIDALLDPDTRERLSPAEFYDRFLETKRTVRRDALPLLEPILSTPLKVTKRGVGFKISGTMVYYGELMPELEGFVGTDRRVYIGHDPADVSSVRVWDERFRFVCDAPMNNSYGGRSVSKKDLKQGLAMRREQRKRVKQRIDMGVLIADPAELAARAARDREVGETKARIREHDRNRDPNDLPNLRIVGTPVDGQAEEIARAEQRKAAGAEHDAPPNTGSLTRAISRMAQREREADDEISDRPSLLSVRSSPADDNELTPTPGPGLLRVARTRRDPDEDELRLLDTLR